MRDLTPYRAAVVGSAVYMFRWRPEAVRFLRKNSTALAGMDVWLFDSGPVGEKIEEQALPNKVAQIAERIVAMPRVEAVSVRVAKSPASMQPIEAAAVRINRTRA